jgi:L-rhamnose-H+ transport protein
MIFNPMMGSALHALGGLGAASFYVPLTGVRKWAWESSWLVANVFFLVVCPGLVAWFTVPQLGEIFRSVPRSAIVTALTLGLCWGFGNLSWGLTLRYLGMSLGFSLALGFCTVMGTLGPPIIKTLAPNVLPNLANQASLQDLISRAPGQATLAGLAVCLAGIALCGRAGISKERELSDVEKKVSVGEFSFVNGVGVALLCGMLSSFFSLAITDTEPIAVRARKLGTDSLWTNSATMALVLVGGAASNLLWCVLLNFRNGSAGDYLNGSKAPVARNYFLCALAGTLMYSEFFFYGIAAPYMGTFSFINFPIHLALVIVLGNVWAIIFKEWKGTSRSTRGMMAGGIALLLLATVFMGYGGYLEQRQKLPTAIARMYAAGRKLDFQGVTIADHVLPCDGGSVDLYSTNFRSPPDTAFILETTPFLPLSDPQP